MNKFSEEWHIFREKVISRSASQLQIDDLEVAFFSGALALISIQARIFSVGQEEEVTEEEVANYDALVDEIVATCKNFTRDRRNRKPVNPNMN